MRRWGAAEEGAEGGNFVVVILFRKKRGGKPSPTTFFSRSAPHTARGLFTRQRRSRRVPACIYQAAPTPTPFFGKRIGLSEFNQKRILVPVPPALPSSPSRVSVVEG